MLREVLKVLSLYCPKTIGRRSVTSGQWWIQGKGLAGPTLIFRTNWGPKDWQKFFLRLGPPPYLRVWMTVPPPLSEGLDLPLQVTMVAKFLELNNLSWQRQPFALSNDGKNSRATVWFLSAIMLIPVIFFFFLPYQGLLISNVVMWYNDISTIVDLNYP